MISTKPLTIIEKR